VSNRRWLISLGLHDWLCIEQVECVSPQISLWCWATNTFTDYEHRTSTTY